MKKHECSDANVTIPAQLPIDMNDCCPPAFMVVCTICFFSQHCSTALFCVNGTGFVCVSIYTISRMRVVTFDMKIQYMVD